MSQSVEVRINGQTFKLKADKGGAYLRQVADYVEGVMVEVQERSRSADSHRVSVMAALEIADRLFRLQQRVDGDKEAVEEHVSRMIKASDRLLES